MGDNYWQIVSGIMVLGYLTRFKTVHIPLKSLLPSKASWIPILTLGIAPFFNQVAMMVVQIVMNNTLTYYGGQSSYGSEIPMACAGIISKVGMIFFAIVIGISQGIQPIISFNYGAGNGKRVKETYKKALTAAIIISTVAFLLFQFFPREIISIFYDDFAYRLIKTSMYLWKIPFTSVLVFAEIVVITTVIELITSYIMEWTAGSWLWDYTRFTPNFQGRIALNPSLRFGVGG